MGCKLIQQMEEIIPRVGDLSCPEFGTKEPILDTSIKNQESDEIMGKEGFLA